MRKKIKINLSFLVKSFLPASYFIFSFHLVPSSSSFSLPKILPQSSFSLPPTLPQSLKFFRSKVRYLDPCSLSGQVKHSHCLGSRNLRPLLQVQHSIAGRVARITFEFQVHIVELGFQKKLNHVTLRVSILKHFGVFLDSY